MRLSDEQEAAVQEDSGTTDTGIPTEEVVGTPTITQEVPEGTPEQTDNSARAEDGEQDVSQDPEPAS